MFPLLSVVTVPLFQEAELPVVVFWALPVRSTEVLPSFLEAVVVLLKLVPSFESEEFTVREAS